MMSSIQGSIRLAYAIELKARAMLF
jgi:hypothetical protein